MISAPEFCPNRHIFHLLLPAFACLLLSVPAEAKVSKVDEIISSALSSHEMGDKLENLGLLHGHRVREYERQGCADVQHGAALLFRPALRRCLPHYGLLERFVRDEDVVGSNLASATQKSPGAEERKNFTTSRLILVD